MQALQLTALSAAGRPTNGIWAGVRRGLRLALLFAPTLLAIIYFGVIATGRYVSEAQFIVRSAAKPAGSSALGAIFQMTGLGRAQDELFAVQSYMSSRSAVLQLSERLPIREIFSRPEADFVARFPSFIYGPSQEELHRYLGWMVETIYSSTTGITTLRVQAFRPEDARRLAVELLDLGELTVNRMNERIQREAQRTSQAEVTRHEQRLIEIQQAITRFRNSELMIDPAGSSIVITELIGRLGADLAMTEAQMREMSTAATTNPQLASLRGRAEALKNQIARERMRISSSDEGLAEKIAVYERLVLDREFTKKTLEAAVRALESAKADARRQQLYLQRIVEPVTADRAMAPQRLRMIVSAFGINVLVMTVGWLLWSGVREHATHDG